MNTLKKTKVMTIGSTIEDRVKNTTTKKEWKDFTDKLKEIVIKTH